MAGNLRTWIEIDKKALLGNLECFSKIAGKNKYLMAVVKSNAYGHGLSTVARILAKKSNTLWFGVDSITEAGRLRKDGIKNHILVLGYTLPERFIEAETQKIIISISNFENLKNLIASKYKPAFFIKIDSGMHRQGFVPEAIPEVIVLLKKYRLTPLGIYSHLASASETSHNWFTEEQMKNFNTALERFKKAGFKKLVASLAATGGTIFHPHLHFNMIRVGMGLYGYPPSLKNPGTILDTIRPVLTWKTIVAEVKEIPAGSYIGYELTKHFFEPSKIAILPIGYWHGYDRRLSNKGEVLIKGKRAAVVGRVSMDMVTIDVTHIPNVGVGDEVVLIGKQNTTSLWADEISLEIKMSHYEFLTRLNPLIRRIIV